MTRRRWLPAEDEFLENNYGAIRIETIARRLDRSLGSVRNRVQVRGLGADRPADVLSLNTVLEVFGIQTHSMVKRWMANGWLPARRGHRYGGSKQEWWIKQDDVAAILRDRPWLFEADKVQPPFDQYITERWLTLVEAFRRGAAWPSLLENAVKAGLIPEARQRGEVGTWWVVPERLLPELIAARRRMTTDVEHRRLLLMYTHEQARGRVQRRQSYMNAKARAAAPGGLSGRARAAA